MKNNLGNFQRRIEDASNRSFYCFLVYFFFFSKISTKKSCAIEDTRLTYRGYNYSKVKTAYNFQQSFLRKIVLLGSETIKKNTYIFKRNIFLTVQQNPIVVQKSSIQSFDIVLQHSGKCSKTFSEIYRFNFHIHVHKWNGICESFQYKTLFLYVKSVLPTRIFFP